MAWTFECQAFDEGSFARSRTDESRNGRHGRLTERLVCDNEQLLTSLRRNNVEQLFHPCFRQVT